MRDGGSGRGTVSEGELTLPQRVRPGSPLQLRQRDGGRVEACNGALWLRQHAGCGRYLIAKERCVVPQMLRMAQAMVKETLQDARETDYAAPASAETVRSHRSRSRSSNSLLSLYITA